MVYGEIKSEAMVDIHFCVLLRCNLVEKTRAIVLARSRSRYRIPLGTSHT